MYPKEESHRNRVSSHPGVALHKGFPKVHVPIQYIRYVSLKYLHGYIFGLKRFGRGLCFRPLGFRAVGLLSALGCSFSGLGPTTRVTDKRRI